MSPIDLVMAFALITSPVDENQTENYKVGHLVFNNVHLLAIKLELISEDVPMPFNLSELQELYQQYKTCPYISDCLFFPDLKTALHQLKLANDYFDYLVEMNNFCWDKDMLQTMKDEVKRRINIYEYLVEAQDRRWDITSRRNSLNILRDILGRKDYYSIRIPTPIPLEFLPWAD